MGFLDGLATGGLAPVVVNNGNPTTGWDKVPVFGSWRAYDGTPIAGTWRVTCPTRVVNNTLDVIYPAGTVGSGTLDTDPTHQSFSFQALANDDPDTSPTGTWKLTVQIVLTGYPPESYVINTPLASLSNATPGVNLRTLTPA